MTYEQYKELPKMVRVIDSTFDSYETVKAMIGDVCEVRIEYHDDKTKSVYTKDKSEFWAFNNSDLQELTHLVYEGYQIGIGDGVKFGEEWYTVLEYIYYNNAIRFNLRSKNNNNYIITIGDIKEVKPLYPQKPSELPLSDEALISEMKKRGLLKDGVVLR